jgi:uncharacterized protein YhhL (DUF1145 family)
MEKENALKKSVTSVAVFIGIMHPIEAMVARRMAKKRGRKPLPWMAATLLFGVFAMKRLKKLPPLEKESGKKKR